MAPRKRAQALEKSLQSTRQGILCADREAILPEDVHSAQVARETYDAISEKLLAIRYRIRKFREECGLDSTL